jgi:hypothetical protein
MTSLRVTVPGCYLHGGQLRYSSLALLGALLLGACATGTTRGGFEDTSTESVTTSSDAGSDTDAGDAAKALEGGGVESPTCASLGGDPAAYARAYRTALETNAVRPCTNGCTVGECCYELTACMPRL